MAFNRDAYDAAVLRPLRRRREPLREPDMLNALAIFAHMSQRELLQRLRDVRTYWVDLTAVPDSAKYVSGQLIDLDKAARQRHGPDFETVRWWRESPGLRRTDGGRPAEDPFLLRPPAGRPRTAVNPPTDPIEHEAAVIEPPVIVDPPPDRPTVISTPTSPTSNDRLVVTPRYDIRSTLDRQRRRFAAETPSKQRPNEIPHADPGPAPSNAPPAIDVQRRAHEAAANQLAFRVEKITGNGSTVTVRIDWVQPDDGHVEVRSSGSLPEGWSAGDLISRPTMETYGEPESAPATITGQRRSIQGQIRSGYRVFVPFIVRARSIIVGHPFAITIARTVQSLDVQRTTDGIDISWMWPIDSGPVEVEVRADDQTSTQRVAASATGNRAMVHVADTDGPTTVTVRSIEIMPDRTEVRGEPESRVVAPKPLALKWRPSKRLGRSRVVTIDVIAVSGCPDIALIFAASPDRFMPLELAEPSLRRIGEFSGTLAAGEHRTIKISIPGEIYHRKSFWLRCFSVGDRSVAIDDPPIEFMKAG